MKSCRLMLLALLVTPLTLWAQTVEVGVGSASKSESTSSSGSVAGARSNQGQTQSTSSNALQAQDASNTNTVAPSQTTTINSTVPANTTADIRYSGTTTQRSAPSVVGPVMNPTTPCTSVISAGGSGIGFGVFIGSTMEDKECTRREFARVLIAVGQMDAGMAVLCGNEMVAKAAPMLCKKVQTALGSAEVLPAVASAKEEKAVVKAEPVKGDGPKTGQVEKGSDGKSYRFNGQGWVPITTLEDVERDAKANITTSQVRR